MLKRMQLRSTWARTGVALALVFGTTLALAEKPDWAGKGHGKHNKHEQRSDEQQGDGNAGRINVAPGVTVDVRIGGYFGEVQRSQVQTYYREESRAGRCPPGLAKKNNGCMPPGQARKWAVGRALPRDVVYAPLEPQVLIRLGTPPVGHKFVRVAGDILLIAVGTSMVMDAIEDLGR